MKISKFIFTILFISILFNQSKREFYDDQFGPSSYSVENGGLAKFEDRKRSVLDKGNMVLRLSNAAVYGYDRWGLNHEYPAGSIMKNGCCTYYWTQSPIVGALVNGQPSVAVGVRGTYRDSEEEFEPLSGYDSGITDTEANIGIALSDKPESWPTLWPIQSDPSGTFNSRIYDNNGDLQQTLSFGGVEPEIDSIVGFPDAPCGYGVQADREAYFVVTDNDPAEGNTFNTNGTGPLNVRIDIWALNYSLSYGNDGLIFIQKMTNVGPDTLKSLYFGVTGDPDNPSQGSSEWTDDLAILIEPNDPLIAEKLSDTTDAHLLGNLAIVYDPDDNSAGFIESDVGWIGLKFLECTHIDNNNNEISYDVSSFKTYPYTDDATSDEDAYFNQLASGIQEPDNISPHPTDLFNKPYTYGPDITWVIAAGPMDIAPGEQVIFTFADFMGVNESDLLRNARLFQTLYDNDCSTPRPPDYPIVNAVPGDGKVYLYWDGDNSENSIDPVTANNAFEGYRIYKSMDNGISWGDIINNFDGSPTEIYTPLAIFDLDNENYGPYAMSDPMLYYDLGNNSGLKYSYVDENVINGYNYYYSVCAYDGPDEWSGAPVDPLENPKQKDAINTISVIPQPTPAGYDKEFQVNHFSGEADAELKLILADPFINDPLDLLVLEEPSTTTIEYEINSYTSCGEMFIDENENGVWDNGEIFEDLDQNGSWTKKLYDPSIMKNYWGIDKISDTIQNKIVLEYDYDISSGQIKYLINDVIPTFYNGIWNIDTLVTSTNSGSQLEFSQLGYFNESYSTLNKTLFELLSCESPLGIMDCSGTCFNNTILEFIYNDGNCDDGLFGIDLNCEEYFYDMGDCNDVDYSLLSVCEDSYSEPGKPSNQNLKLDFRVEMTESIYDYQYLYFENDGSYTTGMTSMPFTISINENNSEAFQGNLNALILFNLSGNDTLQGSADNFTSDSDIRNFTREFKIAVKYSEYNNQSISNENFTILFDLLSLEDISNYGWIFNFSEESSWQNGDYIDLMFKNPVIPGEDIFRFTIHPENNEVEKDSDLDDIRVVPNPFKITSVFQNNIEVKELQFQNLPNQCVIRIFNTAGELVKLIKHEIGSYGYRNDSIEAWNLRTYNEQEIAFGVYLYHIEADGYEKTGKFAVIK